MKTKIKFNDYKQASSAIESYLRGKKFKPYLSKIEDNSFRQKVLQEIETHRREGNGHLEARLELYKTRMEMEDVKQIVNGLIVGLGLLMSEEDEDCECLAYIITEYENT